MVSGKPLLGSHDTFYIGNLKGIGRTYQQEFVDTYSKVGFRKLYVTKTPITAADLLNDCVLPFYESQSTVSVARVLAGRGTDYCGNLEQIASFIWRLMTLSIHKRRQCHRKSMASVMLFHKTILHEFNQVTFRKKLYGDLDALQSDH